MKNIVQKIYSNRFFLLFILLFAYIQSIYTRIIGRQEINAYTFTPEAALATLIGAAILFFIILYYIQKVQKSEVLEAYQMLKIFGYALMTFVSFMLLIGFIIALAFGNVERNFNSNALPISIFSYFLDGIIYGSFFLAYYHYQINKKHHLKLAKYHEALSESKIKQLKTQLNPHFLFNNLNVLDQLIEEDKNRASDFLNEFAEIYRYVLHSTEKELISVEKEIDFAQQYFKLIQYKYGNAYQLQIRKKNSSGYVVPMALQLLLENAVQHNLGTEDNPIIIQITIEENISICNNVMLKKTLKPASGRALKNLQEQYKLLSNKPVQINEMENSFSVEVPVLYL